MIKDAKRGKWRVHYTCLYNKLTHFWDLLVDGEEYRVGEFSLSANKAFVATSGQVRIFHDGISQIDNDLTLLLKEVTDDQEVG